MMERMTIVEFLLARIAEREALAKEVERRVEHMPPGAGGVGNLGIVGVPFWEVLAECKAKRRIVEIVPENAGVFDAEGNIAEDPDPILLALASVYADHPDFDPAWRVAD